MYKALTERICVICKKTYLGITNQKYCSQQCRSPKKGYKRHSKKCVVCNKIYMGTKDQKYCSKECMIKWTGQKSIWKHLPSATVGTIQELRVSIDLLKKGYEVFRALSPSCSCDLLIHKNDKFIGVEVRTAYKKFDGKIQYPKINIRAKNLALALPNEIIYIPEL